MAPASPVGWNSVLVSALLEGRPDDREGIITLPRGNLKAPHSSDPLTQVGWNRGKFYELVTKSPSEPW